MNCSGNNWKCRMSCGVWKTSCYTHNPAYLAEKTNAFKAMFEICYYGPLAIINTFRLGCVPTVFESWREINTAWAHRALLLKALSNTEGLQFQR